MSNTIEITGKQLFRISPIGTNLKYDKDTKLAGQTYTRFRYNGVVFIVNDNLPFAKDFHAGNVDTVFLNESVEKGTDAEGNETTTRRLEFDGYVNNNQLINLIKKEAIVASILKGNFKAEAEVSQEELEALANA
jgi:hypothetical protein